MRFVKKVLASTLAIGIVFMVIPNLYADETSELLLKLLVKKGVITKREANELRIEVDRIEDKEKVPEFADIKKHIKKTSWLEKVKVKGDIRLRNEYKRPGSGDYVNRQRIRARGGAEVELTDAVKAGVAVATTGNARSRNMTLTDGFQAVSFSLDMAYLQWKPLKGVKLTGGKYKNPLYYPGDLLWDSDLRFEGASTNLKYSIKDDLGLDLPVDLDLMFNAGIFVLDDIDSSSDRKNPYLYTFQTGIGSSIGDYIDWKGYIGYLDFAHIKGTASDDISPTTGRADVYGNYYYDYNILELSGEVTSHYFEKNLSKPLNIPIALFGDYIQNLADGQKRHGWELGAKFGKKPKVFGDWRTIYNFRWFDKNAFPDDFPDADAFQGRTDGYGHEVIFSYGLAKNVWLEFDWYMFRDKSVGSDPNDKWGSIFQTDLNVKF